jgi:GNAT superfamily N-acetyltransferase
MRDFAAPWQAAGWDVSKLFYFGESVLDPDYRGRGIGHTFFDTREAHARSFGRYTHTTFCGVVRPDDHPLRDTRVRLLDGFWRKRGYEPVNAFLGTFSWKDVDQPAETAKPMRYWLKPLSGELLLE